MSIFILPSVGDFVYITPHEDMFTQYKYVIDEITENGYKITPETNNMLSITEIKYLFNKDEWAVIGSENSFLVNIVINWDLHKKQITKEKTIEISSQGIISALLIKYHQST